jgi:riboflavin biosynthesis pyrimidine reductase
MVEAGPALAAHFFAAGLVDRVWVFRSARRIDDLTAPRAVDVPYPETARTMLGDDELVEYLNPASPVFFSNDRSSDFRLLVDPPAAT